MYDVNTLTFSFLEPLCGLFFCSILRIGEYEEKYDFIILRDIFFVFSFSLFALSQGQFNLHMMRKSVCANARVCVCVCASVLANSGIMKSMHLRGILMLRYYAPARSQFTTLCRRFFLSCPSIYPSIWDEVILLSLFPSRSVTLSPLRLMEIRTLNHVR